MPQILLLLLAGAGLAQYGNFLMAMLQSFISSTTYQDSMTRITEGKSLLMMIFWMGIVAPAAEEMIFRWLIYLRLRDWLKMPVAAVISGLIFGIYHGNIVQGIYASILGTAFAYILEMSGNIYVVCYFIWELTSVAADYRICTESVFDKVWHADFDTDLSDSAI